MSRVSFAVCTFLVATGCTTPSAQPQEAPYSVSEAAPAGPKSPHVLVLSQRQGGRGPRITRVEILPTRGMNIFRMRGEIPGKGEIELLAGPPLAESLAQMTGRDEDHFGNVSFYSGGPILIPYANRIRGKASGQDSIRAMINDHPVLLPANWKGKKPGAEKHSMHGLILERAADSVEKSANDEGVRVDADIHAGDFGHHWLS